MRDLLVRIWRAVDGLYENCEDTAHTHKCVGNYGYKELLCVCSFLHSFNQTLHLSIHPSLIQHKLFLLCSLNVCVYSSISSILSVITFNSLWVKPIPLLPPPRSPNYFTPFSSFVLPPFLITATPISSLPSTYSSFSLWSSWAWL